MSFTDDLKAALGGAVSDRSAALVETGKAALGAYLEPITKAGLNYALGEGGAAPVAPVATGSTGIKPGLYSVKTPPPSEEDKRKARTLSPVMIGGALLALAGLAWYATRKDS